MLCVLALEQKANNKKLLEKIPLRSKLALAHKNYNTGSIYLKLPNPSLKKAPSKLMKVINILVKFTYLPY